MTKPRDRASATGLLPRMEARPRKDGLTTYRYHPVGSKPIKLGTDKNAAIRQVLDLTGRVSDRGTVAELWRIYQQSPEWAALSDATRADYTQSSGPLLKVFGKAVAGAIKPASIRRYLRVERATAPVRANREAALLSNLMNVAVERGDIDANPCKQVRRNKESPRTKAPESPALRTFLAWAVKRGRQGVVLAGMAEFAALSGNRRVEFLDLSWTQIGPQEVRLIRAKQRGGKVTVEVLKRSVALDDLLERMRLAAADDRTGAVFPSRSGNAYTESGFKTVWNRLVNAAVAAKIIAADERFTFHDLRAYYVTEYKARSGALPDLHANPGTTARVYDRSKEVKRGAL